MHKININYPILVFIIALILCMQNIWGPSIYILDEAKNATCAREMMESADHIVPTYNYQLRTDKPPLHYYFMMISYKLFGVNPFGARFFSSVFGALTVLITFLYTRKLHSTAVAFLASFVLISSLHFILQFHLAVPDPYLVFFLTLAGFAFIDGIIHQNDFQLVIAYSAIGFGVLAKGPVAIVLPGLALLVFLLLNRSFDLGSIKKLKPLIGIPIVLLIAFPWYLAVGIKTDWEWIRGFLWEHNIDRFADPKEGHGGSFFKTWIFVVSGLLPMSVFLIQSLRSWWQKRADKFLFFCGVYALTIIVFFTLADTRLPNYTVPAYPFLAVLISVYLWEVIKGEKNLKWFGISSAAIFFILLAIPPGVYLALTTDDRFFHLKDYWWHFLAVSFTGFFGFYILKRREVLSTIYLAGMGYIVFGFIAINIVFPKLDALNPVVTSLPELDARRPMAHFHRLNPSFPFHIKKEIPKIESLDGVYAYFEKYPDAYLFTRSDFADSIRATGVFKELIDKRELFEPKHIVIFEKVE